MTTPLCQVPWICPQACRDGGGGGPVEFHAGAREQVRDLEVGQFLARGDLVHAQPLGEAGRGVHEGDAGVQLAGVAGQPSRGDQARVAGAEDNDLMGSGGVHRLLPGGSFVGSAMGQGRPGERDNPLL
ncbi:hypothetical protein [Nocardia sp. NPDC050710]|uniref:hypothetical protein n=1 Tax=Nocardia sp. NPDC050710 TaxID=3157220 RepID=UPI0033F958A3